MRQISFSSRRESTKNTRKVFLIVCEGSKTEPQYFSDFPLPKEVIDIEGCGANTRTVVSEAIRLSEEKKYDEIWCVFDRDSFGKSQVNSAISKAVAKGFKVAFSNESFELWYVLHFCYLDNALNRDQYAEKIAQHIRSPYKKNSLSMYSILLEKQNDAIRNAKKLARNVTHASWADRRPYTGVYLLVERLNKEIKNNY